MAKQAGDESFKEVGLNDQLSANQKPHINSEGVDEHSASVAIQYCRWNTAHAKPV